MGKVATENTLLEIKNSQSIIEYSMAGKFREPHNWEAVSALVRSGNAERVFNIGDQIVTTWTDRTTNKTYEVPLDVVAFHDVELEDGSIVPGMWLQWHYATPFAMPFSTNAFYYCENELPAGTYYFTVGSTWGSNICQAGNSFSFTLTQAVPAGGQLSGFYRFCDLKNVSDAKVYSWASKDAITPIETVDPVVGAEGTSLGTLSFNKTDDPNMNYLQSMAFGHNRWSQSAYRQYLNSKEKSWWKPQSNFDRAPQGYNAAPSMEYLNRHGFMQGFEDDFLHVVKPIKVNTSCNTLTDGGVTDTTYDTFFLPSLEQIYVNPQIKGIEGDYWPYWKEIAGTNEPQAQYGTYPERITYAVENHNSAQNVRLRSASRGNSYNVWLVYSSGLVSYYSALWAFRCAPACVIC